MDEPESPSKLKYALTLAGKRYRGRLGESTSSVPPHSEPFCRRRQPLRGDVGDRYSTGSAKVGSVHVSSDVYVSNCASSSCALLQA